MINIRLTINQYSVIVNLWISKNNLLGILTTKSIFAPVFILADLRSDAVHFQGPPFL